MATFTAPGLYIVPIRCENCRMTQRAQIVMIATRLVVPVKDIRNAAAVAA